VHELRGHIGATRQNNAAQPAGSAP